MDGDWVSAQECDASIFRDRSDWIKPNRATPSDIKRCAPWTNAHSGFFAMQARPAFRAMGKRRSSASRNTTWLVVQLRKPVLRAADRP